MKKSSFSYFPIVVAGVCLAVFVMTADAIKVVHPKYNKGSNNIIPGRYIVSFNGKSKSASTVFTQSLTEEIGNVDLTVKQNFSHEFFNGLSVHIDSSDDAVHASTLKSILDRSDVRSVTPVRVIKRPEVILEKIKKGTKVSAPSIIPHAMTQVDKVHTELKNKGKGVLVAVLDTGVDYFHPALGGGFGKGFKVSKGYDLVGDAYTGYNTPVPDNDPLDACGAASGASGHGTHVSGIIAGNDPATNFTGVAPEANLAMFRLFGCSGEVATDVIIQGLLMAYDSGADVINLSLGDYSSWGDGGDGGDETAVINSIVAKGVHVIIAAGNAGEQGIYTVGSPSTITSALSVGSVENDYYTTKSLKATGFKDAILYAPNGVDNIVDGVVVISDKTGAADNSCTPSQISPAVKGNIALIQRGSCLYNDKAANAAAAGASAVIIYNNIPGLFVASVSGVDIPVISISDVDGKVLAAAIQKGTVKLTFDHKAGIGANEGGGSISSFSSLGAESELNFKPQIAGVGGSIYSTLPRYLNSWGLMSGTSMATPYVAGSMALYIHSEGTKKRQAVSFVHEQFQNYALAIKVYNTSTFESPIRQGAGLVQVYDAIIQKTHITPAQITFKDTPSTKFKKQTITVTNRGSKTISYEVKNDVSTAISPYDVKASGYTPLEPADDVSAGAKLRFSTKSFKLSPGKSKKITITVTPPKTNPRDHIFYGGFIHIISKQKSNGKDIKVPYFGVVGSQKTLPIFDTGFPTIIDNDSKEYGPKDTYTFDRSVNGSSPIAVLRLLTPSKTIKAELLNPKTKMVVGAFLTGLNYVGRNFLTDDNLYNQYSWDGTYIPSTFSDAPFPIAAPAGTYLWRFTALKLLGNPQTKKDWETWTSGPIILKN